MRITGISGFAVLLGFLSFIPQSVSANCSALCGSGDVGKLDYLTLDNNQRKFFIDYHFEYQDWDTRDSASEHSTDMGEMSGMDETSSTDHEHMDHSMMEEARYSDSSVFHEGHDHTNETPSAEEHHHNHNISVERFSHLTFGYNISESFSLYSHIPWVERAQVMEGGHQEAEGIGDLDLFSTWKGYSVDSGYLGLTAGIKFPTGETSEKDPLGNKFEPELQPGTGSFDYMVGVVGQRRFEDFSIGGNVLYTLRTEGSQDYEFGDGVSTAIFLDGKAYDGSLGKAYFGARINYHYSDKDKQEGDTVLDSGGNVVFLGPTATLLTMDSVVVSSSILFPVVQDRGGNHQDMTNVWQLGVRYLF